MSVAFSDNPMAVSIPSNRLVRQVSAMAMYTTPRANDSRIDTSHSRVFLLRLVLNILPVVFLVLTICVAVGFIRVTITGFAVALGISFLVYVIHGYRSGTAEALRNQMEPTLLVRSVAAIRSAAPSITLSVRCWHRETRTRVVSRTDSKGHRHSHTETYTVDVTTYSASEPWVFSSWLDTSNEPPDILSHASIRLKLVRCLDFADPESREALNQAVIGLRLRNQHRDVHCDTAFKFEFPGFIEHILVRARASRSAFFMNTGALAVSTLLLCGWLFEMCLERAVVRAEYTVIKTVSANPLRLQSFTAPPMAMYSLTPTSAMSPLPVGRLEMPFASTAFANQTTSPRVQAYAPASVSGAPSIYRGPQLDTPPIYAADCTIAWQQPQQPIMKVDINSQQREPSAPPQTYEDPS